MEIKDFLNGNIILLAGFVVFGITLQEFEKCI